MIAPASARRRGSGLVAGLLFALAFRSAPVLAQTLSGTVLAVRGGPVAGVAIELRDRHSARLQTASNDRGEFRFPSVAPGVYRLDARKIGFGNLTIDSVLVLASHNASITLRIDIIPVRLADVQVTATTATIEPGSTEFTQRMPLALTATLPVGRDAGALVDLVPGGSRGMLWGGAGLVANSFKVDGLSMTHPALGGDLFPTTAEWVEAIEVTGLGAGAAQGNFQGGLVNAVIRSGSNRQRAAIRGYFDSRALAGTNPNLREEGAELAQRRELSADVSGPAIRDRLFYFAAAQVVGSALRVPDLGSAAENDFRSQQIERSDVRSIGKLTWIPTGQLRLEGLVAGSRRETRHLGMTGLDDPAAALRESAPSVMYQLAVNRQLGGFGTVDLRGGGFAGAERRSSYAGSEVPGIRVYQAGREPSYQNAEFRERVSPGSQSAMARWTVGFPFAGLTHRVETGAEVVRSSWSQTRERNGGVTWRPFARPGDIPDISLSGPGGAIASEWGGEVHLRSSMTMTSVYAENRLSLPRGLTLTPGLRLSRWGGRLTRRDGSSYLATSAAGADPRIGLTWDPSGKNTFQIKGHWGIYHQGMSTGLFDRIGDAMPFENGRLYPSGPPTVGSPTQPWTTAMRDSAFRTRSGTPLPFVEQVRNEAGVEAGYRQPYVEQLVAGLERSWRDRWKLELVITRRQNRNVVGLIDRNMAQNYTALHDVGVGAWLGPRLADFSGQPVVLPTIYVSNRDVLRVLSTYAAGGAPPPPGLSYDMLQTLTYQPDPVFSTIPEARRELRQGYVALSAFHDRWSASGSVTVTQLRGNIAGVTSLGGLGSVATAGQWVRPNEAIASFGNLPGYSPIEAKAWVSANLDSRTTAGVTLTHLMGEWFTPSFVIETGRYSLLQPNSAVAYDAELFEDVVGQTIFLEPAGSRHYADRTLIDFRVERTVRMGGVDWAIAADLTNLLGSRAVTLVQTSINSALISGEQVRTGAPRQRADGRTLRLSSRLSLGSG